MFWVDRVSADIIKTGQYKPYWVDDMKTPSGYAHIGSVLGPVIHSCLYRALKAKGKEATFTFVINDFDTADDLLPELKGKYEQYLGMPLKLAPSPDAKFESMADLFSSDFINAIKSLGVEAEILSSWEMYHEGKFDEVIRTALDNSEKIQDIYYEVSGSQKREKGWLPLQVICEKCSKLGTTRVFAWDGKEVSYKCELALVEWAQGCSHEGKISPFGGAAKLPWKVDWAAHWKVIGVTVEGAGKDHASAGGSYDVSMAICKDVFGYPQPYKLPYEFILIGGRKMSSSKGIGLKAHDLVKILPPAVGRFLFIGRDIKSQSNFDPEGTMAIPDLFDEYDRAWTAYNTSSDEALSQGFVYSQIKEVPEKNPDLFLPRFRDVANYMQLPNIDLQKQFELIKGSPYSAEELGILAEREKYVRIWLEKYAPEDFQTQMTKELPVVARDLPEKQKEYLAKTVDLLGEHEDAEKLQVELYELSKKLDLPAKEAFAAIYLALSGRTHGPKAAWFLLQYPKEQVIERLKQASRKT